MLSTPRRFHRFSPLLVLVCLAHAAEQNAPKVISTQPISSVQWRPGNKQVTYTRRTTNKAGTRDVLFAFDLASETEKELLDPIAQKDSGFTSTRLSRYKWSPDGSMILVTSDPDLWVLPMDGKAPRRLLQNNPDVESITFSPDSKHLAFVKENNLFVVNTDSAQIRQLTTDGSETILNATLDWVYGEEFEDANPSKRAYAWSPDSKHIAFLNWIKRASLNFRSLIFCKRTLR